MCRMPCITALRLDEHFTKLKATFKEKSRSLREARYAKEFLSYLAYPSAGGALDIAESKSDTERLHYDPKVCHPYMIEPPLHHLPKWTQCCCCRGWLCPRCTDYVGGIDLHQKTRKLKKALLFPVQAPPSAPKANSKKRKAQTPAASKPKRVKKSQSKSTITASQSQPTHGQGSRQSGRRSRRAAS